MVKGERGECPQRVAEDTESSEILLHASMKASQHEREEERGTRLPERLPPPPVKDQWGRYLTLRVLSSLDQESVEGKEGRDEEEVTNALLPI